MKWFIKRLKVKELSKFPDLSIDSNGIKNTSIISEDHLNSLLTKIV